MTKKIEKVLVSGGSGYIGSNLIQFLNSQGYDCQKINRNDFNDLNCDFLIHCAADYLSTDDKALREANYEYGDNLFKSIINTSCKKIINLSSFSEFGDVLKREPINRYAKYKAMLRQKWENNQLINFISLVIYDVYGENDPRKKLVNSILNLSSGESINLSAGNQIIDFVYVGDVCNSVLTAMRSLPAGIYSVRTCHKPLKEHLEFIEKLQNIKLEYHKDIRADIIQPKFDFENINTIQTDFQTRYTKIFNALYSK